MLGGDACVFWGGGTDLQLGAGAGSDGHRHRCFALAKNSAGGFCFCVWKIVIEVPCAACVGVFCGLHSFQVRRGVSITLPSRA